MLKSLKLINLPRFHFTKPGAHNEKRKECEIYMRSIVVEIRIYESDQYNSLYT